MTEEQAERLLAAVESSEPGDIIDEWGNLSAFVRASSAATLKRLDEGEAAAGFSWEDDSSS